jgi:hypothetical protein
VISAEAEMVRALQSRLEITGGQTPALERRAQPEIFSIRKDRSRLVMVGLFGLEGNRQDAMIRKEILNSMYRGSG